MKKKLFNIMIILICIFSLIELIINKKIIYSTIMYSLNMWVNNLIPSLFPFFIISDILINYNITNYIPNFFKKFCKDVFNITDNMLTILLLSMISGFPSNARNTKALYDKGLIDVDEGNHILMFSHFANPVFILTTVGVFFLNNEKIGIIILISHYFSNIILGILLRKNFKHVNSDTNSVNNGKHFQEVFITSIKASIDTTLLICGIVTVFLVMGNIIINVFNFNIYNSALIKGLFEITIGIDDISKIPINIIYKAVISSCFLAFGGLSVHIQVMSQIVETKINYYYFLIGRIFQVIISGSLTFLLCIFFHY